MNSIARVSGEAYDADQLSWVCDDCGLNEYRCQCEVIVVEDDNDMPTEAMTKAARKYLLGFGIDDMDDAEIGGIYLAMQAARPECVSMTADEHKAMKRALLDSVTIRAARPSPSTATSIEYAGLERFDPDVCKQRTAAMTTSNKELEEAVERLRKHVSAFHKFSDDRVLLPGGPSNAISLGDLRTILAALQGGSE